MDRLHLMATFVAVVDARGFAGAGRKLNLSPPAVTRAIAELESRLGVQLLARSTRVVRVTEAGASYVEDCRRILAEVEEADAAIRGSNARVRGHLLVTAPLLFGKLCVGPIVREFLRQHAEVVATCWFIDRVVNILEEGVDVAVRIGQLPDSSLKAYRVGTVRQVCCASPGYLAKHGVPRTPSALERHTIVASLGVTPGADWRFSGMEGARGVKVSPRLVTSSNDAAIDAAVEGFGIARLLSYQVADLVAAGKLKLVLEAYEPAPLPVHLLHAASGKGSAKVRAFMDLAIQSLQESAALD